MATKKPEVSEGAEIAPEVDADSDRIDMNTPAALLSSVAEPTPESKE